jgi:hypothetical protein
VILYNIQLLTLLDFKVKFLYFGDYGNILAPVTRQCCYNSLEVNRHILDTITNQLHLAWDINW